MPQRFIDVWLEGTSFIPLPQAYPGEPFRLYRNRARGFFLKHAPDYPDIPNDLLVRAFHDSSFRHKMSYPQAPGSRQFRGFASRGAPLRATQMSLAQRQAYIQRRQRQLGFRQTNFKTLLQKASGELKGMDTDLALDPVIATTGTNGSIFCVNQIEAGNGSWNRSGRKAFLKSLRVCGIAQYNSSDAVTTGTLNAGTLRMAVVWDKQPGGSLPVFSDIFGRTSQDGTETVGLFDNLRYDNTGRFQVLRDVYITANPQAWNNAGGTLDTITYNYRFDEFIDLKNRTTIFSGDSDPITIADISSGGLYVVFRSSQDSNDKAEFKITSQSFARLRFTS